MKWSRVFEQGLSAISARLTTPGGHWAHLVFT